MDTTSLQEHSRELIETRLEFRDGGVWLVGLCPRCWEHVGVRTQPNNPPATVTCDNGHTLRVKELRSEGSHHYVS
jgi:hypothetical protein